MPRTWMPFSAADDRYCAPSVDFPTPDGPRISVQVPIGTPSSSSEST